MRVTLDDRLFDDSNRLHPVDLLRLLHFGWEERHLLRLQGTTSHFDVSARRLPDSLRRNIERLLDASRQNTRTHRVSPLWHIRVEPRVTSSWSTSPPALTLREDIDPEERITIASSLLRCL